MTEETPTAEAPAETAQEQAPPPEQKKAKKSKFDEAAAIIADGKAMIEKVTDGVRFKFLSDKLKDKFKKDLLKEILK